MGGAWQAPLSSTVSQSLLEFMSIELMMPSSHLVLCLPLLLLPSIFPSIRVFSNESALCIRWPKYWSFSLNISPSNEHPGLLFFRMDWLDLLAVQWTLKSLLQHCRSKASILQCSAFFTVQVSHPHMTTGKTIRHILIKLTTIKHKEQILKAAREKQQITHKGIPIRIRADLSIETLQDRREWQDILKVMKENKLQPRLLYPARISFKYEGEIKSFTDKQKLREFSTTKPALQQILKDIL